MDGDRRSVGRSGDGRWGRRRDAPSVLNTLLLSRGAGWVATITTTISYFSIGRRGPFPSPFSVHESLPSLSPATNKEELLSRCVTRTTVACCHRVVRCFLRPLLLKNQWKRSKSDCGRTRHCQFVRLKMAVDEKRTPHLGLIGKTPIAHTSGRTHIFSTLHDVLSHTDSFFLPHPPTLEPLLFSTFPKLKTPNSTSPHHKRQTRQSSRSPNIIFSKLEQLQTVPNSPSPSHSSLPLPIPSPSRHPLPNFNPQICPLHPELQTRQTLSCTQSHHSLWNEWRLEPLADLLSSRRKRRQQATCRASTAQTNVWTLLAQQVLFNELLRSVRCGVFSL